MYSTTVLHFKKGIGKNWNPKLKVLSIFSSTPRKGYFFATASLISIFKLPKLFAFPKIKHSPLFFSFRCLRKTIRPLLLHNNLLTSNILNFKWKKSAHLTWCGYEVPCSYEVLVSSFPIKSSEPCVMCYFWRPCTVILYTRLRILSSFIWPDYDLDPDLKVSTWVFLLKIHEHF